MNFIPSTATGESEGRTRATFNKLNLGEFSQQKPNVNEGKFESERVSCLHAYLLIILSTLDELHGQRVVDVAQVHSRPAAAVVLLLLLLLLLLQDHLLMGTAAARVGARGSRRHEVLRTGVRRAVGEAAREQPPVLVDLGVRQFI